MLYTCAKFQANAKQLEEVRSGAARQRASDPPSLKIHAVDARRGKQTAEQRSGLSAVKTGRPTFPSVSAFCGFNGCAAAEEQRRAVICPSVILKAFGAGQTQTDTITPFTLPQSLLKKRRSGSHGKRF